MTEIVYFSSVSGNTNRFVERLGRPALRLPLMTRDDTLYVDEPFVLLTPTYGGGHQRGGAVPKQVIKFLNVAENRGLLRGVIGAGNTNFGAHFCRAVDIISAKCSVPPLYRFELMGTDDDLRAVNEGLDKFWKRQLLSAK